MYIKTFMRDGADEKPHLTYDKTKKLKLQTNGLSESTNETSVTLLNGLVSKKRNFYHITKQFS